VSVTVALTAATPLWVALTTSVPIGGFGSVPPTVVDEPEVTVALLLAVSLPLVAVTV